MKRLQRILCYNRQRFIPFFSDKDEFINSLSTYLQSSDLEVEQFNDVSGYAAKKFDHLHGMQ